MASNGAGGTLMFGVRLTNVTLDPCRLAGYPSSLTGIRATGESVDLHPSDSLTNSNENTEGVLAPGRSGTVTLATTNACYGKQGLVIPGTFTALRIGLPGGGTVTVQGSYRFECGAMVSPLGVEPTL
jgi:hypothetical protein